MPEQKLNTKLCKHCKTEMPYDAKICPQCRKKQGGGIIKWIISVIVVFIIIAAVAGTSENNKPKPVNTGTDNITSENISKEQDENNQDIKSNETPETKDYIFKLGETAELDGTQVTLTKYKESKGSQYNKPSKGNVFMLVEFEITNNSDSEISVSSVLCFDAYADGYSINESLSALLEKDGANQLDGSIAPGKKMKGMIGYEVPKKWNKVEIHYTDDAWSNNQFKFLIEK